MTTDPTLDETTPPQPFDEVRKRRLEIEADNAMTCAERAHDMHVGLVRLLGFARDIRSALAHIADLERDITEAELEVMARAHDAEDAAQMGEPSPWLLDVFGERNEDFDGFRRCRVAAMRAAFTALQDSRKDGSSK